MFDLATMYARFPAAAKRSLAAQALPILRPCQASDLPEPYHELLVHEQHMTVTVERFFGSLVDVEVLECVRQGSQYLRKIWLRLQSTRQVVQFGCVEVHLAELPPIVADQILSGKTPLGRVLIEYDVLRRIEPIQFFETNWPTAWSANQSPSTFGRLGQISSAGRPLVNVVEILAPIADHEAARTLSSRSKH